MSTAKFDTLQNAAGSLSVPVATVVNGSAKAWVNFNGTGTVAIRAGFNVSSITDNGTGDYTVNFTTALPDINYGTVCAACEDYSGSTSGTLIASRQRFTPTTSSVRVASFGSTTGIRIDAVEITVAIFR